jgi:hypothetical protein
VVTLPELQYFISTLDLLGQVLAFLLLVTAWACLLLGSVALAALTAFFLRLTRKMNRK